MAQTVADSVIPLDQFIKEGWYPGYQPRTGPVPYFDLMRPFQKEDEPDLWFFDKLHWGHGIMPGSISLVEDIYVWGTQLASELLPLPPGKGLKGRFGGTHVFGSGINVDSEWQIGIRAARFGKFFGPFLANFKQIWADYERELLDDFQHFIEMEPAKMTLAEMRKGLSDAHVYHARSMHIHFEVMYSLLANFLSFYELNAELGLDTSRVAMYLTGEKTKFMEADQLMWKLSRRSRELGVDDVLASGDLSDIRQRMEQRPNGRIWWAEFQNFLNVYGWRDVELAGIEQVPWIDDPRPPLGNIRTLLGRPESHDFEASHRAMVADRDHAIEDARSKIGGGHKLQQFNAGLASCLQANFAWWNDEHNFAIDQRTQIPAGRLTRSLGERLAGDGELSRPEDVFMLFKHEIFEGLDGDGSDWKKFKQFIPGRWDFYNKWRDKGPELAPLAGTIPESISDPIMLEIFGLYPSFLDSVRHGAKATSELRGLAASRGVVEGIARVIHSVTDIHEVEAGEILVCTATTPDWTPVFGVIKACVCDGGGSLTHAAIVSREYGVPCVVGTASATRNIKTGDRVKVDGDKGIVTIFR